MPELPSLQRLLRLLILLVLLIALPTCEDWQGPYDGHGTPPQRVVAQQSPPMDHVLDVTLDTLWSAGGFSDDRISLTKLRPSDLLADGLQRLYVLDVVARVVHVFDARGNMVATWGSRGPGPGELMHPYSLAENGGNGVAVIDRGKGAVVAWNSEGHLLPERSFLGEPIWGPIYRSTAGGRTTDIFMTRTLNHRSRIVEKLHLANSAGRTTIASITLPPMTTASFPSCDFRDVQVHPLFSPKLVWDHRQGITAVSDGMEYRLKVFDSGTLRATISRNLPPVVADRDKARRYVGDGVERSDCTISADELLDGTGFQELVPVIKELRLAPRERLFVTRITADMTSRVDLVSLDSGYIGTLPSGIPTLDAFLGENEFVSIERDALGVPIVSAYRMAITE